jgi:hypothetical protein
MLLAIYREIQIAKNNSLNNAAALLTGRFFEIFLSEEYGTPPGAGIESSVEAVKDQKLRNVLDFALKKNNEFIKCVTGKKRIGITDDDVEKMTDFIHIFVENYINPRKTADLEKKTGMVLRGAEDSIN